MDGQLHFCGRRWATTLETMHRSSRILRQMVAVAGLVAQLSPTVLAADDPGRPPALPAKRAEIAKNIGLETQGDKRRVRVAAEVCFREGALEMLMCRWHTKEHESVVAVETSVTSQSTRGRRRRRANASTLSRSVRSSPAPPAK